jgi:hypothetical protein
MAGSLYGVRGLDIPCSVHSGMGRRTYENHKLHTQSHHISTPFVESRAAGESTEWVDWTLRDRSSTTCRPKARPPRVHKGALIELEAECCSLDYLGAFTDEHYCGPAVT